MDFVLPTTLPQNPVPEPQQYGQVQPVAGQAKEFDLAMLDTFLRTDQFAPNWQLGSVSDGFETLMPDLLVSGANNKWCSPENSPLSGTAQDFSLDPQFDGSAQAGLVRNSGTTSNAEASKNSEINTRYCEKKVDDEEVAKASKRSRRARNAAKKRHGGRRKRSTTNAETDEVEKKRESNRVAAAKCRKKQTHARDVLYERHQELCSVNSKIKQDICELREQLIFWRSQILQHMNCECEALRVYNRNQACRVAFTSQQGKIDNLVSLRDVAQSCILSAALPSFDYYKDAEINYEEIV